MKYSEKIKHLENSLNRYLFFWENWKANGNCNLNPSEINLIDALIKSSFSDDFVNSLLTDNRSVLITPIIRKLERGYQVFKDFVIVNFLQSIIEMATIYGYDDFLKKSISELNIDDDLKHCLMKFKTLNLQIAFLIYKPEDFNKKALYDIIQEFQIINKKKDYSLIKT